MALFTARSVEMSVMVLAAALVAMLVHLIIIAACAELFMVMSAAASSATSAEILRELSLERYAVGISHQAQLVLKS